MFAIIKNKEILCFSEEKITKKSMDFDEIIEWFFDLTKQYIYENWQVLEKQKTIQEQINEINEEFRKSINQFTAWYTQVEIDSWGQKVKEAEIVINWWSSEFLQALCITWETEIDLANKILQKARDYSLAYAQAEKIKREKILALNI